MIIRNSRKHHPEFDMDEARRVYSASGHDKDIEGELITSPYDLFAVESLRDRLDLRIGEAHPTDVFVFGKGESDRRDCTKVGGLPYWPADRPWPADARGRPYRFLSQFNFTDSRDLVDELPGDVLLMLVEEGDDWLWDLDPIHFEWLPAGLDPCPHFNPILIAEKAGPFFGTICRTADYPDACDRAHDGPLASALFSQRHNLPILNGTKIGGLPHFIQSGADGDGVFLCQLGSIQAAPDVPFPWVNHPEPLGLQFDNSGIYGDENEISFGDMGTIYIFRDEEGSVRSSFECY